MDCRVDIAQVVDVVLNTRQLFGISKQALHLCLGATIAELKVVQHCIILLRKALVSALYVRYIRAHLRGVVSHIHDGCVRRLCRAFDVVTKCLLK